MAGMTVSSAKARRYVRIAQMAVLALGVSAAALWALEVPGLRGPLPEKPAPGVTPVVSRPTQGAAKPVVDQEGVEALAERLNEAAKRPAPAAEKPVTEAPPHAAPAAWRYIAPLTMGKKPAAIVFADGRQRVLRPGNTVGETKLISVDERKLVVEDRSGRHDVLRGERTGSNVLWTKMDSNAPAVAGGAGGAAGLSAEELAKRGIDPSQGQRFREMMRDRARRRAEAAGEGGGAGTGAPGDAGVNAADALTALPGGMSDRDASALQDNPKLQSLLEEFRQHLRRVGMDAQAQEMENKLRSNGVPQRVIEQEIRGFKDSQEHPGAVN